MITGKLGDLSEVAGGTLLSDQAGSATFEGLSIDSRTIRPGNLFVAIIGEFDDGHKYLDAASESGAGAFLVQAGCEEMLSEDLKSRALSVPDSQKALREIGLWWSGNFSPRVIALTGTNGKTTTKELIADVLAKKYSVFRSPGNYNNLYGIPLSLCMLNDSYEVCVYELGMSYAGEIEILTKMVNPDLALITNIGPAHLETMGTIENIARAKFELLDNIRHEAVKVLNTDDPILKIRYETEAPPKYSYAVSSEADIMPGNVSVDDFGRVSFDYEHERINLRISGYHNLYNALAACTVGKIFKVEAEKIKEALEAYESKNARMQIIELEGLTIINDSYNANPTSMGFALDVLTNLRDRGRRIAVLGDMRELGDREVELHQEVGELVIKADPDLLVTVGRLGMHIASQANLEGFDPLRTMTFRETKEAIEFLEDELKPGDQVLIKASRAMNFDLIVKSLEDKWGGKG